MSDKIARAYPNIMGSCDTIQHTSSSVLHLHDADKLYTALLLPRLLMIHKVGIDQIRMQETFTTAEVTQNQNIQQFSCTPPESVRV